MEKEDVKSVLEEIRKLASEDDKIVVTTAICEYSFQLKYYRFKYKSTVLVAENTISKDRQLDYCAISYRHIISIHV